LLKAIYAKELDQVRGRAPAEARLLEDIERSLASDDRTLREAERAKLDAALPKSRALQAMVSMRRDLAALWERSAASSEQLVGQDWRRRAEASGIEALSEFSRRLRSYA
jgi:stearoyl-CoA desaturase (Delta-9 desaturase)